MDDWVEHILAESVSMIRLIIAKSFSFHRLNHVIVTVINSRFDWHFIYEYYIKIRTMLCAALVLIWVYQKMQLLSKNFVILFSFMLISEVFHMTRFLSCK